MGLSVKRRLERLAHLDDLVRDHGWRRVSEGLACAPGASFLLEEEVGGLVFDIDGVLMDTHRSFREVIPQSVNFFLEVILGEDGDAPLMRVDDVHPWKGAGGFNNDWDVAEAGLIHALWWGRDPETAPALQELSGAVAEAGGGLTGLRRVLQQIAGSRMAEQILLDVDRVTLERIFKELYVGGARFREVFEEEPRFYKGSGGMERERPLVEGPLWETARRHPLAILTGRIPAEARLAMASLGLLDTLPADRVVTDDGRFPTKPDPAGLAHIASGIRSRPLLYFGDNRDDLNTLLGARGSLGDEDLHFVYCLSGSTDSETVAWFAASGSALVAVEVSDALAGLIL